jgi:hypothetical protein
MRVWDIEPSKLCNNHLLGEHREIHAIWTILTEGKRGYSRHPETLRWVGKLKALYKRHEEVVSEMTKRGFSHMSPLDSNKAIGKGIQDTLLQSIDKQKRILKKKGCSCRV